MSYFHRPPDTLEEHSAQPPEYYPVGEPEDDAYEVSGEERFYDDAEPSPDGEPRPSVGAKVTELRGRITRALSTFDRGYVQRPSLEAGAGEPDRRRSGRAMRRPSRSTCSAMSPRIRARPDAFRSARLAITAPPSTSTSPRSSAS